MQMHKTIHVTDREQWRQWLQENHAREREVWLVFQGYPPPTAAATPAGEK